MKKLVLAAAMILAAATAYAGNVHRDGNAVPMQLFAPTKTVTVTHTKAAVTYTPTSGTRAVRIRPSADISYKLNGTGAAYPVTANTNEGPFGVATRGGVGTTVSSIVFTGISTATKTIYIQEQ